MNARIEDALIDAHNAGELILSTEAVGYEILSVQVFHDSDIFNLPAFRCSVAIAARWQDEHSTRPLTEWFYGYGPTRELAEQQAAQAYNAWRVKLNCIAQRSSMAVAS